MFSFRTVVPALLLSALPSVAAAQDPIEIVVNVNAGRLDVLQAGERIRSYPVSVGQPAHATPTGAAAIRRMVWNPTWTPPASAWARDEKPAGPGWGNPMGRVKMHLFEDYYIHGTPRGNERRLGQPVSHGCIRMRNTDVMELARLVLSADGAPVAASTIEHLARNPGNTRELALRGHVRVRIESRLTEVNGSTLTLLPDVYAQRGTSYVARVQQELRASGLDPDRLGLPVGLSRAPATPLVTARMDIARPAAVQMGQPIPTGQVVTRDRPELIASVVGAGQ